MVRLGIEFIFIGLVFIVFISVIIVNQKHTDPCWNSRMFFIKNILFVFWSSLRNIIRITYYITLVMGYFDKKFIWKWMSIFIDEYLQKCNELLNNLHNSIEFTNEKHKRLSISIYIGLEKGPRYHDRYLLKTSMFIRDQQIGNTHF